MPVLPHDGTRKDARRMLTLLLVFTVLVLVWGRAHHVRQTFRMARDFETHGRKTL